MSLMRQEEQDIFDEELLRRLSGIRMLLCDVDGVLTDGRLFYGKDGEVIKTFHVRDGMGVGLLQSNGIKVAIVSARGCTALQRRLRELNIESVYLNRKDKARVLDEVADRYSLSLEEVAYIGDDLVDLPVLRRVGVPITVSDAHSLVRKECQWITSACGGDGAIREVADRILDIQVGIHKACEVWLEDAEKECRRE